MHRQVLSRPESLPKAAASGGGAETDLHLGFWRNPKRFNVAITRAKALLVRLRALRPFLCCIGVSCCV